MKSRTESRSHGAWLLLLLAASPVALAAGDVAFQMVGAFPRDPEPAGLSALSHVSGNRYYSVDDRGGLLYELEISLDAAGRVVSCSVLRKVALAGRVDLEGCAYDPLDGRVWVSDEHDSSIRAFDPATGRETARAPVPDVFRTSVRPNRSLEALALSPDGLRMYAANEDTLVCDGESATTNKGGVVRIQEWTRTGRGAPWQAARSFRYPTHRLRGAAWHGHAFCGVSALAVDADGSLLVLERELSRKNLPVPTIRLILSRVSPAGAADGARLKKTTLWQADTGFANGEGLAPGPVLADGSRPWLIVSDAGGGLSPLVLVLKQPLRKAARRDPRL